MLIRINTSENFKDELTEKVVEWSEKHEILNSNEGDCVFEAVIEPSKFREITTFLQKNYSSTAPEIVEQSIINKTVIFIFFFNFFPFFFHFKNSQKKN